MNGNDKPLWSIPRLLVEDRLYESIERLGYSVAVEEMLEVCKTDSAGGLRRLCLKSGLPFAAC